MRGYETALNQLSSIYHVTDLARKRRNDEHAELLKAYERQIGLATEAPDAAT